MSKILLVVLGFVAVAVATENAAVPELTSHFIATEYLNDLNSETNSILSNAHLKNFYNHYYSRPQEEQKLKINKATKRVDKMSEKALKNRYPYAGQFSMDPNSVSDVVNYHTTKQLLKSNTDTSKEITSLYKKYNDHVAQQNSKLDTIKKDNFSTKVNNITSRINQISSSFREIPEHTYSSPFSPDGPLSKITETIRDYEHQVKRPLAPLAPNPEEINALNRLNEKMAEISKRIHQKPLENLHQDSHAQDLMMDRLSNLIRRMSNAVSDDHQAGFLQQLHMMLHTHHLHDHRFMSSLESEIAFALAHGQALPMPRDYSLKAQYPTGPKIYKTAPKTQEETNPLHLNYAGNMAAQSASNYQSVANRQLPMYSYMWSEKPSTLIVGPPGVNNKQAAAPRAPGAPSNSDPAQAMNVAHEMHHYGKTLIDRSKEMKHRADIIERRETIPSRERQELMAHIQNRLVNPPAQVHPVGASRPIFFP